MIHKKRITGIITAGILLLAALPLSGCGSSDGATAKTNATTSTVESVLEQGIAEAEEQPAESAESNEQQEDNPQPKTEDLPAVEVLPEPEAQPEEEQEPETLGEPDENVDVDLTVLSATMVYSEVYNMMMAPDDYVGKKIKMKGLLSVYYDAAADKTYFACIIQDATACCAQGIEFVLTDEYTYPDDYPETGEEICVAGTFETYTEGEFIYMNLKDAWIAG